MNRGKLIFTFISLYVNAAVCLAASICSSAEHGSRIGLFISPILSRKTIHEIEIYWNNVNYLSGDVIALFTETPSSDIAPIYTISPDGPDGVQKTGLRAEFIPSENLTFVEECLKYHVAWMRDGVIKQTNCIRTQPNWMRDRKDILGQLIMSKVFLPGTHNSGSYMTYELPRVENVVERYAITQDIDVLAQLIHGVRYLDIRIGYYPLSKETWWVNHGIYRSVPLQIVINHVKTFLDNTEEIVIFDLQEFPIGFGKNLTTHHDLVMYLENEFEDYLLHKNYGWMSTLDSIWSSERRLIIGYDNAQIVAQYESMWPPVLHQWGNVRNVDDLFEHLNRVETAARGVTRLTPRSAMAELTPTAFDVILNRLGGLRQMAENVNLNVTNWYSTLWKNTANVVAADFIRSTGIVQTAIESNERRNSRCKT